MQKFEDIKITTNRGRGFYDITADIKKIVGNSAVQNGLLTAYIKHTSASLLINENYDPDGRDNETPNVVLIDNQATVTIAKSKKVTSKNRHIRRREHFVRQGQEQGEHSLHWLPAEYQLADIMTKTQDSKKFLPLFSRVFSKIPDCVEGTKSSGNN